MNEDLKKRLMVETARAWRQDAASDVEPPRAGDLLILDDGPGDGPDVEWVVLDLEGDRALIVPADTRPEIGSSDVEIPEDAEAGPLSLRCGHALRITIGLLRQAAVTGRIADDRRLRAVELVSRLARETVDSPSEDSAGGVETTEEQRRTDDDFAYRAFIAEVPATARRRLLARLESEADGKGEHEAGDQGDDKDGDGGRLIEFAPSGRDRDWWRGLSWAAALVLAILLALSGGFGWRTQQRVEDLENRLDAVTQEPLINPTSVVLRQVRGARTIELPDDSDAVVLTFDILGLRADAVYRVEALAGDPPRMIWKRGGLRLLSEDDLLGITLPRGALPPGDVRLRLEMSGPEEEESVGEFWIFIEYKQQEISP